VDPARRPAGRAAIVAVDDDAGALARVRRELERRYAADYDLVCTDSPEVARAALERIAGAGGEVALVLADQWMPGTTGTELLQEARRRFPLVKRGLLVDWGAWGDPRTREAILRAMALGRIDYYVLKPWRSPDELFHRTVAEFVHEWSRTRGGGPQEVTVVGPMRGARSAAVRSFLARNGIPHAFLAADSPEGGEMLATLGHAGEDRPVVGFLDGPVLVDPGPQAMAAALGLVTKLERSRYDVAVVGAGPAGLAAAVYGASEGLDTLVIEREALGGQAGTSSMIRNYLGFARGIPGAELAMRAYQQAWVFGATFLMTHDVEGLDREGGDLVVRTAGGDEVRAGAMVLATGISYRRLGIPELDALTGAGVFYGASASEASAFEGEDVYLVGGGNSAGQAALHLARHARSVVLVVRAQTLADSMSHYLIEAIGAAPNVVVRPRTEVIGGGGDGRLEHLVLRERDSGRTERVPLAALFVLIGAVPRTDWLPPTVARDRWGFVLTGPDLMAAGAPWPLERPPFALETSLPGLFAAGDVRHGSVKRVASAVGEGAIAIKQVHDRLALG
jgi:thioredoxin reductase (NADPH)